MYVHLPEQSATVQFESAGPKSARPRQRLTRGAKRFYAKLVDEALAAFREERRTWVSAALCPGIPQQRTYVLRAARRALQVTPNARAIGMGETFANRDASKVARVALSVSRRGREDEGQHKRDEEGSKHLG